MKKAWFMMALVAGVMLGSSKLWADGAQVSAPGPVIAATGQNYWYPSAPSTAGGALLVQDGIGAFRYSNSVITTTTSLVALQFPAMPLITKAQELVLPASTTGQMVICTDCLNAGSGKGTVCVSTGSTTIGQFVNVSSGTACQ